MFSGTRPVRRFLIAQVVCIVLLAVAVSLFRGRIGFIAVIFGGGVSMLNSIGTALAWPLILEKKDIALALSIIVSKFALSLGVFYWLTLPSSVASVDSFLRAWFGDHAEALPLTFSSDTEILVAFALGLASVVPAALVVAGRDLWSD